jgi:membrane-bound lytic murein transglycosylase B
LIAALTIVQRGDMSPSQMVGAWAGELGQTQFLPSHYLKHAVDFDGDGRRNLMSSPADVVASTGAFMQHLGWQKGQPWLQEVRVTKPLPWDQADLALQHPRSKWAGWGVTQINGQPLSSDALPASLVLPMGRFGPAFLAYENFQVYLKWNQSLNYALTAAHLAARLAGAPPYAAPTAQIHDWSQEQMKELQQQLARRGYDVGEIDGKMGAGTRAGVKAAQIKFGLPADSYPTPELLERLRAAR